MIMIFTENKKRCIELTRGNTIDALINSLNDKQANNALNILKILEAMSNEQLQEMANKILNNQ